MQGGDKYVYKSLNNLHNQVDDIWKFTNQHEKNWRNLIISDTMRDADIGAMKKNLKRLSKKFSGTKFLIFVVVIAGVVYVIKLKKENDKLANKLKNMDERLSALEEDVDGMMPKEEMKMGFDEPTITLYGNFSTMKDAEKSEN